jgi:hypothetical protein
MHIVQLPEKAPREEQTYAITDDGGYSGLMAGEQFVVG